MITYTKQDSDDDDDTKRYMYSPNQVTITLGNSPAI